MVTNDFSDDKKVKRRLEKQDNIATISTNIKEILCKKKIKYEVEIVESDIDISGIKKMMTMSIY